MTGTGTQTDPFVPTIWDDFVTAVGTPGAYVAFPEGGGVIDMSGYGFFNAGTNNHAVTIGCASIEGNGWKIRGLSWQTGGMFKKSSNLWEGDTTISNLHFTDFYGLTADTFFSNSSSVNTTFMQCTFAGIIDDTELLYCYYGDLSFDRCSFAIELKNNSDFGVSSYRDHYYYNCNIKITGTTSTTDEVLQAVDFEFCYLSGEVKLTNAGSTAILKVDATAGNYSIVDISVDAAGSVSVDNDGGTIVNKDKINASSINITDTTFAVTEDQLHDAEYLNSIGFAIGVD